MTFFKHFTTLTACSLMAGPAFATQPDVQQPPVLAVVIVVDQMRADYFDRYGEYFTGGLARLMRDGRSFEHAWVDHAFTNSLPGHTSIITGAYPRRHGMIDNVWHERSEDGWTVVPGYSMVTGDPDAERSLDVTTLPEWVTANDPRARFLAFGSSTNSSRLYVGTLRGPVIWFSRDDGQYETSEPYMSELPGWVDVFNRDELPTFKERNWPNDLPADVEATLRPDVSPFENRGEDISFPHNAPVEAGDTEARNTWFYGTPWADAATLAIATRGIYAEGLGRDSVPDIVTIALNSLDENGHAYGPFSHEQTNAIFRLDDNLATFMDSLDEMVGEGHWTLVLTADHGVATTPEELRRRGSGEGVRISQEQARALAEAAYAAVENVTDPTERARLAAEAIESFDFVERVYSDAELAAINPAPDSIEGLLALSYRSDRFPVHPFYIRELPIAELGVTVLLKEDVMMDWATAIHGSPYDYDRHVPLYFYGNGVSPGRDYGRAATVDIAPTLANLMGVPPLNEIDGRVIELD